MEEEEVQGVWIEPARRKDFEVIRRGETIEFCKEKDGEFYIAIDGYQRETFSMSVEQFAVFKEWIMEN